MNKDKRWQVKFKAKILNFHITAEFGKFTSYAKWKIEEVELIAKASISQVNSES